jgi:hypothetical protein
MEQPDPIESLADNAEQDEGQNSPGAERPEPFEVVLPGDARKISTCRGAGNSFEKITFQELEQRAERGCSVCAFRYILQKCVAWDLRQENPLVKPDGGHRDLFRTISVERRSLLNDNLLITCFVEHSFPDEQVDFYGQQIDTLLKGRITGCDTGSIDALHMLNM